MSTLPIHMRHAYGTRRKFHVAKRKDLRTAMKAIDELHRGSAYLPSETYAAVQQLGIDAELLMDQLRKLK